MPCASTPPELYPIYNVPFRVATLATNVGFAGACNTGASLRAGPDAAASELRRAARPRGLARQMRDFYDATPNIGALGPKMLYEDDSIQHAGMYFTRYPDPGLRIWVDATYYKGMHSSLPAANIARPVPAVSGACLMIERELFEDLGGLQQIYVRGDYEDSHLCLELLDRGRETGTCPTRPSTTWRRSRTRLHCAAPPTASTAGSTRCCGASASSR